MTAPLDRDSYSIAVLLIDAAAYLAKGDRAGALRSIESARSTLALVIERDSGGVNPSPIYREGR